MAELVGDLELAEFDTAELTGELFLRGRGTRFPGKEIAELFGITGGRLAEQIEANILNLTGDRHRRIRSLVSPAFTPRAAEQWRPAMREIAASLWAGIDGAGE